MEIKVPKSGVVRLPKELMKAFGFIEGGGVLEINEVDEKNKKGLIIGKNYNAELWAGKFKKYAKKSLTKEELSNATEEAWVSELSSKS